MRIEQYGVTIELPDDDRRVAIIQALLYGAPLPPPLSPPRGVVAPDVPPDAVRLWTALSALQRRELVALAAREYAPADMEAHLGISQPALMGQHGRLARLCRDHGVEIRIRSRGRGRDQRRFWLDGPTADLVRRLAAHGPEA